MTKINTFYATIRNAHDTVADRRRDVEAMQDLLLFMARFYADPTESECVQAVRNLRMAQRALDVAERYVSILTTQAKAHPDFCQYELHEWLLHATISHVSPRYFNPEY